MAKNDTNNSTQGAPNAGRQSTSRSGRNVAESPSSVMVKSPYWAVVVYPNLERVDIQELASGLLVGTQEHGGEVTLSRALDDSISVGDQAYDDSISGGGD